MAKSSRIGSTFLASMAIYVNGLKQDDIVLVVSTDTHRENWPIDRVMQVYPGKDGHTRVVRVQVGQNELLRPISKLCPI